MLRFLSNMTREDAMNMISRMTPDLRDKTVIRDPVSTEKWTSEGLKGMGLVELYAVEDGDYDFKLDL